jgi:ribonuclease HII
MFFDQEIVESFFPEADLCLGTDEVGRGPLAGPVISCTVIAPIDLKWEESLEVLSEIGVCDSKKLTEAKRQKVLSELEIDYENIQLNKVYSNYYFQFVVTEADHDLIDEINIHHASLRAMQIGIEKLMRGQKDKALVLVDGKWKPKVSEKLANQIIQEPIIKGDSKSLMIGIASIIAKEYRDSLMKKMDLKYPGYGLGGHSGYPTPKHKAAIEELGPSPIHRKTFKGVREFLSQPVG